VANNATVAVLGTGIMGAAMAHNLLKTGMEVRVWNHTREKAQPLAKEGAKVTNTPTEAAEGADFLATILSDADVVEEVVGGEEGPLSALTNGGIWLQMSTVGTEGNERLGKISAGRGEVDIAAVYHAADRA
jgi:3-hydroxyisobutyrate dehydrogenase